MPDLQPISSEKDILAEAATVVSPNVNPVVQPVAQMQPTVTPVSPTNTATSPIQPVQPPTAIVTPAPMSYRPSAFQPVNNNVTANYAPNVYTYPLPMTSYVFAWLYIISAIVAGSFLVYFLYLLGQASKYSSYMSSSSISAITSQYFGSVILPFILITIACIAAFIFIRSNTKTSRYISLAIAGLLTGYEIYWVIQLFSSNSSSDSGYSAGYMLSTIWSYYAVFIIPFLLYLLLPTATVIYLVTKKARNAYNRIF